MKRNGDIKSFFRNYEAAKRRKVAAEEQPEYEDIVSNIEDEAVHSPPPVHSAEIEFDNRFDEVNTELLICMSALNPLNSFASYDALKVMRLAEFYPMDISSTDLIRLEFQLATFIDDMRQDDRFRNATNIGELSIMLVATKKHVLYDLVYSLIKLILILPVATASVERVFSAMNLVKNKLRTSMSDDRLNDCLVTFIERDAFMKVSEEDIVDAFMAMQQRRVT